ncbi:hypothetical protein [Jiangella sp. DSM 45060]|uniref:hypothetical protein n=1 Tax=Jiangella sp. DSM 45060 TaxID=1798224 RepID=UPI0008792DD6|nr:hypothetical protein [Jiangella sp. DSM 45060]SDT42652.1 hypothetical protein SAMN04515669_4004 [Jiangella sp. DSM 45060]
MTMDDVVGVLRRAGEHTMPPEPFDLDAVVRGGETRRRRSRMARAGAVVVVAAVGLGAAIAWQDRSTGTDTAVADPGSAEELLALLAGPLGPDDHLPAELSDPGLVESTARAVAATPEARFWAVVDIDGEVCFVVQVPAEEPTTALSCAPPAYFADNGLPLSASGPGGGVRAWLLPDGDVLDADLLADWTVVNPNLAIQPVG